MAVERIVLRSQRVSIEEETIEGTPVPETANGALTTSEAGAAFNLGRDVLEGGMMSGSFSGDAPEAGMWEDGLGVTIPTKMRGIGTLTTNGPDWQMLAKSAFGIEYRAQAGTVAAASKALTPKVKTGCASPIIVKGQLLYFPSQGEVRGIQAYSAPDITLEVPLSTIPTEDQVISTGVNWMLTSSPSHPIFTTYGYFGATWAKRIRLTSCKVNRMSLNMTVGGHCDMEFVVQALEALYDNTAQAVTPVYDFTTSELTCLSVDGFMRVAGIAKGSPTATETILNAPKYDVRKGDQIQIQVSAGVWETKTVTNVSGDAGGDITVTHGTVSTPASATDTVYILRSACADVGESLSLVMECPLEAEKCMFTSYGKKGLVNVGRTITIESEPYFQSWEQFLMRDNAVGMNMMAVLGDTSNNIVAINVRKKVNAAVTLNNNNIMTTTVSSRGVKDAVLGDEYEMVMAAF